MIPKIIACDFDGTLSFTAPTYPQAGPPNWDLIKRLKAEQESGTVFILWTCREGTDREIAVNACKTWGITPDFVNENHPEAIKMFGYDTRKIFAHEYWDDRAVHIDFAPQRKQVIADEN